MKFSVDDSISASSGQYINNISHGGRPVKKELNSFYTKMPFPEPEHLRKLFIGGLNYSTTDAGLKDHFERWGKIEDVVVIKDPTTKCSRRFGFITYSQSYMVDKAQNARPHKIDGRIVQSKRAVPRENIGSRYASISVNKLYVCRLCDDHDEYCLREHFKTYGTIVDVKIMTDKYTGKKRGYAFIEFDDYDPVDKIILHKNHTVRNKLLNVRKAIVKQNMYRHGGGGAGSGCYTQRGAQHGRWGGGARGGDHCNLGWGDNHQNDGNWGGDSSFIGNSDWFFNSDWFGNNGNFGGNRGSSDSWNNQLTLWNNTYTTDVIGWNYNGGNSYGGCWDGAADNYGSFGGYFGNNYQQKSYSGGPKRNKKFGNSRPAPYIQSGLVKKEKGAEKMLNTSSISYKKVAIKVERMEATNSPTATKIPVMDRKIKLEKSWLAERGDTDK